MRQPERNCSLLKAAAIPHALGEGHRVLRALTIMPPTMGVRHTVTGIVV